MHVGNAIGEAKLLRHYSVWLSTKRAFKSGHIKNYRGKFNLGLIKCGISRNTFIKYVDIWISNGWAKEDSSGGIVLVSGDRMVEIYPLPEAEVNRPEALVRYVILQNDKDLFENLRKSILYSCLQGQSKKIKTKLRQQEYKGSEKIGKRLGGNKFLVVEDINQVTNISLRSIAKKWGLKSHVYANKLLRKAENEGTFQVTGRVQHLGVIGRDLFNFRSRPIEKKGLGQYLFHGRKGAVVQNGVVMKLGEAFRNLSNQIDISDLTFFMRQREGSSFGKRKEGEITCRQGVLIGMYDFD